MYAYQKPVITTLDSREILEMLGPAQGAGSGGANGTYPALDLDPSAPGGSTFGRR